mgnify:CR=1 FL=1
MIKCTGGLSAPGIVLKKFLSDGRNKSFHQHIKEDISIHMFRKSGFTLLELIVVMAVIAILVAMGVPRFIGYQKDANVTAMQVDTGLLEQAAIHSSLASDDDVWPVGNVYSPESDVLAIIDNVLLRKGSSVLSSALLSAGVFRELDNDELSTYIRSTRNTVDSYFIIDSVNVVPGYLNELEGLVFSKDIFEDRKGRLWSGLYCMEDTSNVFVDDFSSYPFNAEPAKWLVMDMFDHSWEYDASAKCIRTPVMNAVSRTQPLVPLSLAGDPFLMNQRNIDIYLDVSFDGKRGILVVPFGIQEIDNGYSGYNFEITPESISLGEKFDYKNGEYLPVPIMENGLYSFDGSARLSVRLSINGNNMRARVWPEGAEEPNEWHIDIPSDEFIEPGLVGLVGAYSLFGEDGDESQVTVNHVCFKFY